MLAGDSGGVWPRAMPRKKFSTPSALPLIAAKMVASDNGRDAGLAQGVCQHFRILRIGVPVITLATSGRDAVTLRALTRYYSCGPESRTGARRPPPGP